MRLLTKEREKQETDLPLALPRYFATKRFVNMVEIAPSEHDIANSDLKRFVHHIGHRLITVSLQSRIERAQMVPGKWFSPQTRVRGMTIVQFFSREVQLEIQQAQSNGFDVYYTMNEGDGVPADPENGNLNCGRRTNIRALTTLAIDTDEADAELLLEKLKNIKLLPHAIIETSPKRYHFYFFIEPVPAEGDHILQWKALQKYLASLVPGLDQSLCDINQVLRLPSYYNLKRRPFHRVRLYRLSEHAPYNLAFTFNRLEAHLLVENLSVPLNGYVNGNGTNGYHPFTYPESSASVSPGNRRQTITRFIEHLMENVVPLDKDELLWAHVDVFIEKYLRPEDRKDFLPGGTRRSNIEQYFHDQREYRLRKKRAADAAVAVKEFEHVAAVQEQKLPDEFYLRFPGDLGRLTREFHAFSPALSPELCFSGALCVAGALKAETHRLLGYWPLVNGLVIAPTGAGKSTLIHVIERCFQEAGLMGEYSQYIRHQSTVQSLHAKLYAAGGVGTTVIDEAGDYLQVVTSPRAPAYARDLKAYYKRATTGRERGVNLSPGESISNQHPPIYGGFLSVWMLLQPDKFQGSLSLEDMKDGFLPRFLIFRGQTDYQRVFSLEGDAARSYEPSVEVKVWMEALMRLLDFGADAQLIQTIADAEAAYRAEVRRPTADGIREAKRRAVHAVRTEARVRRAEGRMVQGRLTREAEEELKRYLNWWESRAKEIHTEDELDPRLDVFVRVREMVFRMLAVAMPEGRVEPGAEGARRGPVSTIDATLVQAVCKLHRFQTERFFTGELEELSGGGDQKNVLKAVIRAVTKHQRAVVAREVVAVMPGRARPKSMTQVLRELVDSGDLAVEEHTHSKTKRKYAAYLPCPPEHGQV